MRTVIKILKWAGVTLLGLIIAGMVFYGLSPKGPGDLMAYTDRTKQPRELFIGREYAAV